MYCLGPEALPHRFSGKDENLINDCWCPRGDVLIEIAMSLLKLEYLILIDKAGMVSITLVLEFLLKVSAIENVCIGVKEHYLHIRLILFTVSPFKMTGHSPAEIVM